MCLAFASISLYSFSRNNLRTVKGRIQVYGNEPFTFIGIKTTDNKEYAISADEEMCKELRAMQGQLIVITGIIISPLPDTYDFQSLKDGKIEVSEWTILD